MGFGQLFFDINHFFDQLIFDTVKLSRKNQTECCDFENKSDRKVSLLKMANIRDLLYIFVPSTTD